jgi:hypothetical protein
MQHPELPLPLQILRRRPRGRNTIRNESALGQKRTLKRRSGMSASPPQADIMLPLQPPPLTSLRLHPTFRI